MSFLRSVMGLCLLSAAVLMPSTADACGGCFGPPPRGSELPQIVTDHRMVMAIHANDAILWDQIRYSGQPQDFSWVLPVTGDVRVEVASGDFFDVLDAGTAVGIVPPSRPTCPSGGSGGFGFGASNRASDTMGRETPPPVTVLRTEVVGPYQTVVLRSSDSTALVTWLRGNAYVIPPEIMPTIQWYTERHMDFVALRLRPGEGVNAMQPIRIRYNSMNVVLPLRMVGAGIGDKVGIVLWVFGMGRWEAANFANGTIETSQLVWNWNTNASNYTDVFNRAQSENGGRTWITEVSGLASSLQTNFASRMSDAGRDDWNLATDNNANGIWITRMRTELTAASLDNDLLLRSNTSNLRVSNVHFVTRSIGDNPTPVCAANPPQGYAGSAGAGIHCAARPGRHGSHGAAAFVIAGLLARRARRIRAGRARPRATHDTLWCPR